MLDRFLLDGSNTNFSSNLSPSVETDLYDISGSIGKGYLSFEEFSNLDSCSDVRWLINLSSERCGSNSDFLFSYFSENNLDSLDGVSRKVFICAGDVSNDRVEVRINLSYFSDVRSSDYNVTFNIILCDCGWSSDILWNYSQIDDLCFFGLNVEDHHNSVGFSLTLENKSDLLHKLEVFQNGLSWDLSFQSKVSFFSEFNASLDNCVSFGYMSKFTLNDMDFGVFLGKFDNSWDNLFC